MTHAVSRRVNHLIGHDMPYLIDKDVVTPQLTLGSWAPAASRSFSPPILYSPVHLKSPLTASFTFLPPFLPYLPFKRCVHHPPAPDLRRPSDRLTRSSRPVTRYRWSRSHPPTPWDVVLGFKLSRPFCITSSPELPPSTLVHYPLLDHSPLYFITSPLSHLWHFFPRAPAYFVSS